MKAINERARSGKGFIYYDVRSIIILSGALSARYGALSARRV